MKIVLQRRDYVDYATEAALAFDVVTDAAPDENGLVLAIRAFNNILVKLSGFQQDVNSDSVDKLGNDVAFKELRLKGVKEGLANMKGLITERLSRHLDPYYKNEQFAGLETLKFMTWAHGLAAPFTVEEISATDVADVCRSAVIRLTRTWSFEIKLSMFKCCSIVGVKRPLAQVVKEIYSMDMTVFLPSCYPGYAAQAARATEVLMANLNIGTESKDEES
jgi:hypothetical protein